MIFIERLKDQVENVTQKKREKDKEMENRTEKLES